MDLITIDEVKRKVEEIISDILKENSIFDYDLNDPFEDIGFNSINYIKLIVSAEKEFKIAFDDEYLDFKYVKDYKNLCNQIFKILEQ